MANKTLDHDVLLVIPLGENTENVSQNMFPLKQPRAQDQLPELNDRKKKKLPEFVFKYSSRKMMRQIGDRAWHYIHKSNRFGSPSMIRKVCRGNSSHLTTGLLQITLTIIAKDNNHQCLHCRQDVPKRQGIKGVQS